MMLAPLGLLVASAALAFALARRDHRHRPVAIALGVIAGTGLARLALDGALQAPGPYTGWLRVVFHADQALLIAGVFTLPWLATETFAPNRHGRLRYAFLAFAWAALLIVYLVTQYPELRGDALRRVYLVAELASLFACVLAIVPWLRARGSTPKTDGDPLLPPGDPFPPGPGTPRWYTIACVLVLVLGDGALLFVGAWGRGLFGDAYVLQQAGLLAIYASVVGVQVAALMVSRQ